jgi:hypothetical protein
VVEFAMNHLAVIGNHEHMMLDFLLNDEVGPYSDEIWFMNGGRATLESYGVKAARGKGHAHIPMDHLTWMMQLPMFIKTEKLFASHAPFSPKRGAVASAPILPGGELNPHSLLWNRDMPEQAPWLQVFGHNSHWGLRRFDGHDGQPWAWCLDDSQKGRLTALNTLNGEIYHEPF